MAELAESVEPTSARGAAGGERHYRLLQASLLALRAGPALILFLLIVFISLTTPIFFTSRNLGNVLCQRDLNEALVAYREAIRLDPTDGYSHYRVAIALDDLGAPRHLQDVFAQGRQ